MLNPINPLQDAGLLCERLKRAGLDVRYCEIGPKGPFVELNNPTREAQAKLAEILMTHDEAACQVVLDDIAEDRPVTRREVRAMLDKLRTELGGT